LTQITLTQSFSNFLNDLWIRVIGSNQEIHFRDREWMRITWVDQKTVRIKFRFYHAENVLTVIIREEADGSFKITVEDFSLSPTSWRDFKANIFYRTYLLWGDLGGSSLDHVGETLIVKGTDIQRMATPVKPLEPETVASSWEQLFALNEKRLNDPPILDVGDEKVTVGVPWGPGKMYVAEKFFENLAALRLPAETIFVIDVADRAGAFKQAKVAASHNMLKQGALDNGSKYFMLIEADNLPPPEGYLRMKTLIEKYDADVANIPYGYHTGPKGPIFDCRPEKYHAFCWRGEYPLYHGVDFRDLLTSAYPFHVTSAGFGCTLFTPKAIGKEPWFTDQPPKVVWCTDGTFGIRVKREKLKFLVDNRVFCQHLCCPSCFQKVHGEPKAINVIEKIERLFRDKKYRIIQ